MPDYLMPRLSDTMEEGTVNAWLLADGDTVEAGAPLVEIETDKATMVCDAEVGGVLRILVGEGETALVGGPIAQIGDGSSAATTLSTEAADGATAVDAASTASATAADAGAAPNPVAAGSPDVKASPIARRMARQLGIDLSTVAGSGSRGRIVRADVELAQSAGEVRGATPSPQAASAPQARANGSARGDIERLELSRLQTIIARRMVESKTDAPEFFLSVDVDMTAAGAVRGQLKELAGDDPVPSFNDFIVRAAAGALAKHPLANAAFVDDAIEVYSRVNVGIAVAAPGALLVPTVFDADQKSLGAIARETRRLALAGRDGGVTPADLSGGTFSVSNLGMFGIRQFQAVLNPPQAGILAVGAMETRPVWDGDAFVPRSMMTLTLTCDHRILYGADAAKFLGDIRGLLERPLALAL